MGVAEFTIQSSPSSSGGYDAAAGATLTLRLEALSASVQRWTVWVFDGSDESPGASGGAPALSLHGATAGTRVDAATPSSSITITLPMPPNGASWVVRSLVNGGIDANGAPNADYVFERIVAVRAQGLRKLCRGETTQYSATGIADAIDEVLAFVTNTQSDSILISGFTAIGLTEATAWRWDSKANTPAGVAPNDYVIGDNGGAYELLIPADCKYVEVLAIATSAAGPSFGNTIDPVIDGAPVHGGSLQFTTPGVRQTLRLLVPGSGQRRVRLYEQGCFIVGLTPHTTARIVPRSKPARSLAMFGASGTIPFYAWDPSNVVPGVLQFILGWPGALKTSGRFGAVYNVSFSGYGLQDHLGSSAPTQAQIDSWLFAQVFTRCDGDDAAVVYEFGAGDFFHANWSIVQAQSYYALVADRHHFWRPLIKQYWKTPIVCDNPSEGVPNAIGVTMQDTRNLLTAMGTARSAFVTMVYGYLSGVGGETQGAGQLADRLHTTADAQLGSVVPYDLAIIT